MISYAQEHDGAVDPNSPEVTYTFSDGSNDSLRKLSVSTPSGHKVNFDYGAANSIADAFNRPDSLRIDGKPATSSNTNSWVWSSIAKSNTHT